MRVYTKDTGLRRATEPCRRLNRGFCLRVCTKDTGLRRATEPCRPRQRSFCPPTRVPCPVSPAHTRTGARPTRRLSYPAPVLAPKTAPCLPPVPDPPPRASTAASRRSSVKFPVVQAQAPKDSPDAEEWKKDTTFRDSVAPTALALGRRSTRRGTLSSMAARLKAVPNKQPVSKPPRPLSPRHTHARTLACSLARSLARTAARPPARTRTRRRAVTVPGLLPPSPPAPAPPTPPPPGL